MEIKQYGAMNEWVHIDDAVTASCKFSPFFCFIFDLFVEHVTSIKSLHSRLEMKKINENDVSEGPTVSCITAILSYSKGFVCTVCPDTICLFEKAEEDTYKKSREIQVNVPLSNENVGGTVGFVFL